MGDVASKPGKACRSAIDRKARRCLHCRADQRSWAARHKVLTALGVVVVFFGVTGAFGQSGAAQSQTPAASSAPAATDVPTAVPTAVPVLKVSGATLAQQFDANKVASGYFGLTSMQCFVSGPEAVTSVVNGQPVTVHGRIDDQTLGVIAIKDCSVVQ